MVNVPVLILFFNRPEALTAVFNQVRKAQPSHLFLYQDGPRSERDMPGIEACRRIVENVDWPCEVHRLYQEKNYGCDPSNYMSQRWAFEHVDRCIFFEDDDVPSVSFFGFCAELFERYANDPRISLITGTNYDEFTPDMPCDYFFTTAFNINGFGTWRRVFEQWEEHYEFLDDAYAMRLLRDHIRKYRHQQDFIEFCRYHRNTGKAYYETLFHANIFLNSGLSIVPRVNMVSNLGACGEGTHYSGSNADLPRAIRRIFEMGHHDLPLPLKHPKYIIEDVGYKDRFFRTQGWGHPWLKVGRSLEELWLNLRHGNFRRIGQAMKARFRKLTGRARWD
mgnify:FL=1